MAKEMNITSSKTKEDPQIDIHELEASGNSIFHLLAIENPASPLYAADLKRSADINCQNSQLWNTPLLSIYSGIKIIHLRPQ